MIIVIFVTTFIRKRYQPERHSAKYYQ